jgi:hypothetical protein
VIPAAPPLFTFDTGAAPARLGRSRKIEIHRAHRAGGGGPRPPCRRFPPSIEAPKVPRIAPGERPVHPSFTAGGRKEIP